MALSMGLWPYSTCSLSTVLELVCADSVACLLAFISFPVFCFLFIDRTIERTNHLSMSFLCVDLVDGAIFIFQPLRERVQVSTLSPPVIEVLDVNFKYPTGPTILKNVNFGLDQTSRICIVGPNGAGVILYCNLVFTLCSVRSSARPASKCSLTLSWWTRDFFSLCLYSVLFLFSQACVLVFCTLFSVHVILFFTVFESCTRRERKMSEPL